MTFAQKLIYLRKQNGLSQEELAERLGVSRQAVSRWEQGNSYPDLPNLQKLTQTFAVSADYLIQEDSPETPPVPRLPESLPPVREESALGFRANRFLIIGFIWLFAAACFLIAALSSLDITYCGLALADVLLACLNFCLHFREQKKNQTP